MRDFLAEVDALRMSGGRFVMATLVAAHGGSPRPLGTKVFIGGDRRLHGAVSIGGCADARLVDACEPVLGLGHSRHVTVVVDDDEASELGLTCGAEFELIADAVSLEGADPVLDVYRAAREVARVGGCAHVVRDLRDPGPPRLLTSRDAELARVAPDPERPGAYASADGRWFVERIAPPDTLVIVGATDVALALTSLAAMLAMHVIVVDGRERPATRTRFADAIHVGMPSDLVRPYLRPGTWLVLACHDYRYELPILREALRAPLAFIGMLSSRKRAAAIRALLQEDGLSAEEVARLQAPVGLDIGGREPEDIALSIAAQLVAVREGRALGRRAGATEPAAV